MARAKNKKYLKGGTAMHKVIQQFIDGIDEVSSYTLQGPSQFSEVAKLAFVKNFLKKTFEHTDTNEKLSDPVMYHDFMPNTVTLFVNEIKHETLVIIISEDDKLVSATIGSTR